MLQEQITGYSEELVSDPRQCAEEVQRTRSMWYRSLFDNSRDGIILTDPQTGKAIAANPEACRLLGLTEAEICNMSRATFMDTADPRLADALETRARTGSFRAELSYRRADGTPVFFDVASSNFAGPDGETIAGIFFSDVTERRQTEEALRQSEALFRTMFAKHAAVMLLVEPASGAIVDANPAAETFYGYPVSQLCSMSITDLNTLSPDQVAQERQRALRQERNFFVFPHRLANGEIRTVEVHSSPIALDKKSILFSIIHDITERQQAASALRQSEARWQFALEGSGDGVWDWDAVSNQVFFSRQWKAMLGFAEDELTNTLDDWASRLHPDDKAQCFAALDSHFAGETPIYQSEHRVLCKDGTYKWVLDRGKVIEWTDDGKPRRVIGTHTDITERRHQEEEIRRLNATLEQQVGERTAQLEAAVTELQRADKMKDEFMTAVTNELRTPLIGVLSMAEVLEMQSNGALNERQAHYVESIHQSGDRLLSMVNSILRYTSLIAGNVTMKMEPCPMAELCAIAVRAVRDDAIHKRQTITFNVEPVSLAITSDAESITRILQQLLDNAVKFTPTGGQLGLRVYRNTVQDKIHLLVWDTGIGIEAKQQATIFAPFVQGESGLARRFVGVGLGLAYVKRLVELLNGTIAVESTPGEGSRFTVTLPIRPVSPPLPKFSTQPPTNVRGAESRW